MTDRELMQEALDALETICGLKRTNIDIPVAIDALRARLATCDRCGKVNPAELHTCTPPQREWVGLTDDEYELMAEKRVTNYFFNTLDYAHDIETKLKEKNT